MNRVVCEVCGSCDLMKQGSVFICRSCGCKYSLEEVRKMLDNNKTFTDSANQDEQKINTLIAMAQNAKDSDNNADAEKYAVEALLIDQNNTVANRIKGYSSGCLSSAECNRFPEVLPYYKKALMDKSEKNISGCIDEIQFLLYLNINFFAARFSNYPSDKAAKRLVKIIYHCFQDLVNFEADTNLVILDDVQFNINMERIITHLQTAFQNAYNAYYPKKTSFFMPTEPLFTQFINEAPPILDVIDFVLDLNWTLNNQNGIKIYTLATRICSELLKARAYRYECNSLLFPGRNQWVATHSISDELKDNLIQRIKLYKAMLKKEVNM